MGLTKGKSVLVVEDHLDTQLLMKHILKNEGYSVTAVGTASAAFEHLTSEKTPDVILLDLTLPEMDGSEFMRKLKRNTDWSSIKVLIVSGWDNLAERAKEVGADGYLRKPFQVAQFYRQLEQIFNENSSNIGLTT